jgi:chemotaxis protein CheX
MQIAEHVLGRLLAATEEVFETMCFKPLIPWPPMDGDQAVPPANVVASVAFAGHRCGLVSLRSSLGAARDIAGAMLGEPADTLNRDMPDAMGEITNMIAGSFRTKLAAIEPPSAIAVPSVTVGSDFSTRYSGNIRRVVCPFRMGDESIYVELILTGD